MGVGCVHKCIGNCGCVLGIAAGVLLYRMDRIKARQQKYKKGKERMLSLTQESGEGQDLQKVSEEDDESMLKYFLLHSSTLMLSKNMI